MAANIWFIADTHFGHDNIREYEPMRKQLGPDIHTHDEALITNWNRCIRENDMVYHLGDVALYKKRHQLFETMSRLNGCKYLIQGNHDGESTVTGWKKAGFIDVYRRVLYLPEYGLLLSHRPVEEINTSGVALIFSRSGFKSIPLEGWETGMGILNVHGHLHSRQDTMRKNLRRHCVSVECTGFYPVHIEELLRLR